MRSFTDLFSALGFAGPGAVGSLLIILVLVNGAELLTRGRVEERPGPFEGRDSRSTSAVSYTHLTLPTIYSV